MISVQLDAVELLIFQDFESRSLRASTDPRDLFVLALSFEKSFELINVVVPAWELINWFGYRKM
jgi:hypothetical protein